TRLADGMKSPVEDDLESEFRDAGIPFIRIHRPLPKDRDAARQEANAISNGYQATIVMWGEIDPGGVRLFFEVTPRRGWVGTTIDELKVSVADLKSFDSYVFQGMDTLYVVYFVTGQIDYFGGKYNEAMIAFNQAEQHIPKDREADAK